MEDFEMLLSKMSNDRVIKRQEFYKSNEGKLFEELVDFKCWCYAQGKFYNLSEADFNRYKKEQKKKYNFNFEMEIFAKWFGYEFEYDDMAMKWKTTNKKNLVINKSEVA